MVIARLWLVTVLLLTRVPTASTDQTDRISSEEREALLTFYNATGGPTWVHKDRWLGPPGSECHWYGVLCGKEWKGPLAGSLSVQALELPDNGLAGDVPSQIAALKGLRRLILRGNAVKAPLPEGLLQRFDEGGLEIDPLSLIHDVEELAFNFEYPSMSCSGYKAKISANGSIHMERRLCRKAGKQAQEAYCERRDGKTYDFDLLGRFLIQSGFFSEPEDSTTVSWSDMGQLTLTAKRRSARSVTRTWNGVTSLSSWSLAVLLEGTIARTNWSAPPSKTACSPAVPSGSGVSP